MKLFAATLAICSLAAGAEAQQRPATRVAPPDMQAITPPLATYTDEVLFGDVWKRPELAPRDRSLVTISALVAGGHTEQMTGHFNRALDNGVKPAEIAAIITHLAFYAGWPRAVSAIGVAKDVFAKRGIATDALAAASNAPLPLDPAADAPRAAAVEAQMGGTAPALARYTNSVLFGDLWRRTDLAPRDRSLVTITALIASGQVDQLGFHIDRGMSNGLTRTEVSEIVTHLAFYAGWPRAVSAVAVAKKVFEARTAGANAAPLEILRQGSQPATKGSPDYFIGSVSIDQRFQRNEPARLGGGIVTFQPGAHTAWHTHPLGQTLIVTSGTGWVQREGGPVEEIKTGDVVWIPPGVRHWHGATATTAMSHVALAEALDGKSVDWMEHVPAQQYRRPAR
ncbi:MAG: carboxymuconolactone decarboxylase family protein [Alphaproteobacteria bacterium]|nr:carboxymuconolactone decarboxylase family protein [Alphaproteobacteria bacterium]